MKHLKLLPLLIAAAFALPRAHAAAPALVAPKETTGNYAAACIGLGLLLLGARSSRSERFKGLNEE